jgi:hypothetical protein
MDEVRISKGVRYDKGFTPAKRFEPDADTLALYHFDEGQGDKLTDSSGNGHHGKIVGAKWVKADGTPIAPAGGPLDQALSFDGRSSVQIPSLTLDQTEPFTLEALVTPGRQQKELAIVAGIPSQFAIRIPRNHFEFWTWWGKAPSSKDGPSIVENRRVHVAAVFTKRGHSCYIDGKKVTASARNGDLRPAKEKFQLGSSFVGVIDEVRFSKVARYDKDFTPEKRFEADGDTIALYHCDEGSGDKLIDSSGNGHHGTIFGAKWVKVDGTPLAPAIQRMP